MPQHRLGVMAAALAAVLRSATAPPVRLIIDTDIGGGGCNDVDDVVAICIGHAMEQRGELELLAIVQDTAPPQCAGAISVLNTWYGSHAPIGAYDIRTPGATLELEEPLSYVPELTAHWPSPVKNTSQAVDGVALYRKTLAAQPDRSVRISSIGILTNLAALLKSRPDVHSPLSGLELVRQKVELLAIMGGRFEGPGGSHSNGPSCNTCGGGFNMNNRRTASAASGYVAAHWPAASKIIWLGAEVGLAVQSGGLEFQKCAVAEACKTKPWTEQCDPCAAALITYEKAPDKSRFSWDPLTTLVAVRGAAAGSTTECTGCDTVKGCCDGYNTIDAANGNNTWIVGPKTNQTFLILDDAEKAGAAIDELLCRAPTLRAH